MKTPIEQVATKQLTALVCFAAAAVASTGCQLMERPPGRAGDYQGLPSQASAAAESQQTYRIEVAPTGGRPKSALRPLAEGMTVDDAIKQSGAKKKLGKIEVQVIRIDPTSNEQIRMGVEFGPKQKYVLPNYDYLLHPNDRVVIREQDSSLVDSLLGVFAR